MDREKLEPFTVLTAVKKLGDLCYRDYTDSVGSEKMVTRLESMRGWFHRPTLQKLIEIIQENPDLSLHEAQQQFLELI